MKREELGNTYLESLLSAMEGNQAAVWTALPGIIQSFDPTALTCRVQPAIQSRFSDNNGNSYWIDLPVLTHVPVIFPNGGGFSLTFPIRAGDECLVIFASRCIDGWWYSGGYQNKQLDIRMHDLSDGFALVGARSQTNLLTGVSTDSTELRSDAGTTKVAVKEGHITMTSPVEVVINSPLLKVSGDILDNYGTNVRTAAGMRAVYNGHHHSGVQTGTGTTSIPDALE